MKDGMGWKKGRRWRRPALAALAAFALAGCGRSAPPADAGGAGDATPVDEGASAGGNLDLWLERLEVGSRELYAARENVAAAVGLRPGERIADIGAGTGLYTLLFAEAAGPAGAVFAVDIEPRFLRLINQRASDLDLTNVTAVLGREQSVSLPAASVDVVFISDTYNYFEDPAATMATVFAALKPGGRLFVLDFDIEDGAPRTAENMHVRIGRDAVAEEIRSFGFEAVGEVSVEGLSATYMLQFRKPKR